MEARIINKLKNNQTNIRVNILNKGLKDLYLEEERYKINNNKISKGKDLIQKINEEENKGNINENKTYISNYKISLQNNQNENFLVNKDIKYENILENKITNEIAFYNLQKKKKKYIFPFRHFKNQQKN